MKKFLNNKKILITGHTGFKGSWLTLWLTYMGANVLGISSNIVTRPSNFEILKLKNKINNKKIDLRNYKKINKVILDFKPDFLFHLAAEAIVKKSYVSPKKTWETNTLGTINILESLRNYKKKITVVIITSDKAYKNIEISRGYKEQDGVFKDVLLKDMVELSRYQNDTFGNFNKINPKDKEGSNISQGSMSDYVNVLAAELESNQATTQAYNDVYLMNINIWY